jgi:hypothetical protein
MTNQAKSLLGKALLVSATALAAIGVVVGLPMKKSQAAPMQAMRSPDMGRAQAPMAIVQPRFVSPTATTLLKITQRAMSDRSMAERVFKDPDGVARQFHLSDSERKVLQHMDEAQFQTARADAERLVAARNSSGARMPPGATDAPLIAERMVVGRAILAAVGRSYLEAASANACCPWSKAIEVGVAGDPAAYDAGFAGSAAAN